MIQLLLWHQSPLFEEENDQMRCESHFQCLDLLHIYFEPRRNKFCVFVYVFNCICLIFHRCICIILTAPPYVCALNPACGAVPSLVALERQTSKKGRDCGKKVALQKHLVTAGHVRRGSRTFRPQPPQKRCHVM